MKFFLMVDLSESGDFGQVEVSSGSTSSRGNPAVFCKACWVWLGLVWFGCFFLLSSPGKEVFLKFARLFKGRGKNGLGKKKSEKVT